MAAVARCCAPRGTLSGVAANQAGLSSSKAEHRRSESRDEVGELVRGGGEEDAEVDGPVAVHDSIPAEQDRLAPRDLGLPLHHGVRHLAGGFAEHGEVPQPAPRHADSIVG